MNLVYIDALIKHITLSWYIMYIYLECIFTQDFIDDPGVFLPPVGLPPLKQWRLNGSAHTTLSGLDHGPLGPKTITKTHFSANGTGSSGNVIEQSKPCTPEENLKQLQCLREIPAERYEVLEGEDVQMRCRVAHQRGKAQWRAGNFLLGYTRSIPGWKRYSLQGDPRLGIHDLLIQNVKNEDAGTYECQVSPVDGHSPLRRQSTLSILSKPDQPIIVTPAGNLQPSPNGELVVQKLMESSSRPKKTQSDYLDLICQSKGGNPHPTFEWFHNGKLIQPVQNISAQLSPDAEFTTFNFPKNYSVNQEHFSQLLLNKDDLKTGDRIVCLVSNKATLRSNKLSQQKLRAEVIITVHVPPGDPEIIDWIHRPNRTQTFNTGDSLEATCRSTPAGVPAGELSWRFERLETVSRLGDAITPITIQQLSMPIPSDRIIHQYTEDKLLSKVSVPRLNASHHGLDLVCAVKHPVGPERTSRVSILVRHNPEHVYIRGPAETITKLKDVLQSDLVIFQHRELPISSESKSKHLFFHPDRPQYILCLTSPFYAQTEVKWYGYLNITGRWEELEALEKMSYPVEPRTKTMIHTSFIQLVSTNSVSALPSWSVIKCSSHSDSASNGQSYKEEILHQVTLYPFERPSTPVINHQDLSNLLPEGTNISLRCEAFGGRPVGQIVWIIDEKSPKELSEQLKMAKSFNDEHGRIWSVVRITLKKEYNGIELKCAAENTGYPVSSSQTSTPFQLSIAFPATFIKLTVSDDSGRSLFPRDDSSHDRNAQADQSLVINTSRQPQLITADAGTIVFITCRVDLSNPPSKIQWILYKCHKREPTSNDTEDYSNCAKEHIKDTTQTITSWVQSTIQLRLNWSHHGNTLECLSWPAYDNFYASLDLSSSDLSLTNQATTHRRALSESLQFSVRFKPTFVRQAEQLKWPMGIDIHELGQMIIPQYITSEGDSVQLDLKPYANPPTEKFAWFKDQESLHSREDDTEKDRLKISGPMLRIDPVQLSDMSNYTLLASNTLGTGTFQFFLNVTYGPRLIGTPILNVTATEKQVKLDCEAMGNPIPIESAVRWRLLPHRLIRIDPWSTSNPQLLSAEKVHSKTEEQTNLLTGIKCTRDMKHDRRKYFAKCWSPRKGVLKSTLTINNLNPSDVGRYQCYMDNAVGSPAVKLVDLIYPFAPRVIRIPRWSKAAPTQHLHPTNHESSETNSTEKGLTFVRLTCVIAAEPAPLVDWTREPANLTLVEGGQFRMKVNNIHPGLYQAHLFINQPKSTDIGRYYCKVSNAVGIDTGMVILIEPSKPDLPSLPRVVNATSSTLAIAWTQGYNGGPDQRFKLRWAPNDQPREYKQDEIPEELESETVEYVIKDLQKATTYRIAVSAANELFGSTAFTQYILATTEAKDNFDSEDAMRDEAQEKSSLRFTSGGKWNTNGEYFNKLLQNRQDGSVDKRKHGKASAVIVVASVFGAIVLMANLIVVFLLAHKKRRQLLHRKKGSLISMADTMKLGSTGPSYTDMGGIHHPSYTAYTDGASLTGEVLMHSRSTDQFSPFQTDFGQYPIQLSPAEQQVNFFNQPYSNSPQPSLQLVNPMLVPTPTQLECNSSYLNTPDAMETPGMSYREFGMENSPHNLLAFRGSQHTENLSTSPIRSLTDGQMLLSSRFNAYPSFNRIESPQSGPNSCISAPRSSGYPNTHSLERTHFNAGTRAASGHYGHPIVRQSSFGHYAPNGTMNKHFLDQTRLNSGTLTPNQTLYNYRTKHNPMVCSFYADRGFGSSQNYMENPDKEETLANTGSIVRRGSYNRLKYRDDILPTENYPVNNIYVQRYNDQLQCMRALNRQLAASKTDQELQNIHVQQSNLTTPEQQNPNEGFDIPPPNGFCASNSQSTLQLPSDMDASSRALMENALTEDFNNNNNVNKSAFFKEVKFASVAPVKRPTPDHSLLYSQAETNQTSQYGSVV